ncbi:MAG: energy-coupling factor transporter ATPase [Clostridia bacterium]|nr:energy-coupling factor transporter ATPase [Clostridia bacterium]
MNNILELCGVSYEYSAKTPFATAALKSVDLAFGEGRITGVIGHTGSGKSTLVQMLNGLLRPTEGRVLLSGKDIWEKPKEITKVRFRVGLVMQYPEHQLFDATVRADIGFGPRNMGLSPEEIERRVSEAAAFVGIGEELLDKSPFDLSGGQRRRVAIAGVIAMRPEVLILDEPAAGLDPRGRREILTGLWEYGKSSGTTLILVSHSMEDMAHYCDDVVVMNNGSVYMTGSVSEVFSRAEELEAIGLDVPEVAKIATALRRHGIPLEGDLYTVESVKQALLRVLRGEGET